MHITFKKFPCWDFLSSAVVKTLHFSAAVWVPSPVRELRSHMLCGVAGEKKKKKVPLLTAYKDFLSTY